MFLTVFLTRPPCLYCAPISAYQINTTPPSILSAGEQGDEGDLEDEGGQMADDGEDEGGGDPLGGGSSSQ